MDELFKLRPDRDLQCYFHRPSAVAALSECGPDRWTLSGCWRSTDDWAVLEWNRDNVLEHPGLRPLPDGDFRGVTLSYVEERTGCIPVDANLYPTVDWPVLRIWADGGTGEQVYKVALRPLAIPARGSFQPAAASFTLSGTVTAGDYAGIAFLTEHHTYQVYGVDTLETVAQALADSVNAFSPVMRAEATGQTVRLSYTGDGSGPTGANGNRVGAYAYQSGSGSLQWDREWARFSGGVSPAAWRFTLRFDELIDTEGRAVPVHNIRKMRWTYAAGLQDQTYARQEFVVRAAEWQVTGTRRGLRVAGPGSVRVENDSAQVQLLGGWQTGKGNFSGGSIAWAPAAGSEAVIRYHCVHPHDLYLGGRAAPNSAALAVEIDGVAHGAANLFVAGEDVLVRRRLAALPAGEHRVVLRHVGAPGENAWFDFLEAAVPDAIPASGPVLPRWNAATDWDTDHSLPLAPERTAWMLRQLGLQGRVNHYIGAMWFYELRRSPAMRCAQRAITFSGTAPVNGIVSLTIGRVDQPGGTVFEHLVHVGDSPRTVAVALALRINNGSTGIWAEADGATLRIWARRHGTDGNQITAEVTCNQSGLTMTPASGSFAGGAEGEWFTDETASPRLNRAARDWTRAFYRALAGYGLEATSSFSMELQHGDYTEAAGLAQRYPDNLPVLLMTPALQTNFSPASLAFWRECYLDAARLHVEAGLAPYLQFGEVQWWYLSVGHPGMPFYDEYTRQEFTRRFGRPLPLIAGNDVDPAPLLTETTFLAAQIGEFTEGVIAHVRAVYPECRFEVLYPTDVNLYRINALVNYPELAWTPAKLDCLKTEGFITTTSCDLQQIEASVRYRLGQFGPAKRAHLVGCGDPQVPWRQEAEMAVGLGYESVTLWALDQFCLIGFPLGAQAPGARAVQVG